MATPQTAARSSKSKAPPSTPPAAAPKPQSNTGGKAKASGTVVVACKIPTGLELQLEHMVEWIEDTPSGPKTRKRYDKIGHSVFVRGTAYPVGSIPKGYPARPMMVGGYALTTGIDAEFWDRWLDLKKDSDMVKSRAIFAYARRDEVRSEAMDSKDVVSGLEPLNPDGDRRMPRPINAFIEPVKTAPENPSQFQDQFDEEED